MVVRFGLTNQTNAKTLEGNGLDIHGHQRMGVKSEADHEISAILRGEKWEHDDKW